VVEPGSTADSTWNLESHRSDLAHSDRVRFGAVGCGLVRFGRAWCGTTWQSRQGLFWYGVVGFGMVRQSGHGMDWCGSARFGMAGVAGFDAACYGMAW